MRARDFFIVDVFAEQKYAGNQLAVVLAGGDIPEPEMQLIAREMNFSETAFIISDVPSKTGFKTRIFTPREEVPFAGHPSLGTAYVIFKHLATGGEDTITLDLKVGQITVSIEKDKKAGELLFMQQPPPTFGTASGHKEASEVFGLGHMDLDGRYPVQEVSTGLPFVIVPVRSLDAMRRIHLDQNAYYRFVDGLKAKAVLAFCTETYSRVNQINVRMFAPYYGITEDPATGSGGGCLAAYLVKHGVLGGGSVDVRVEQGYEIERPSLLRLRAEETEEAINVSVGGGVQLVAGGTLF